LTVFFFRYLRRQKSFFRKSTAGGTTRVKGEKFIGKISENSKLKVVTRGRTAPNFRKLPQLGLPSEN
jgi:hypothetical protein